MDKCFYWIWAYPYKTHIQSWVDIQLTWSTRTLDIIAISISSMCLAAKPTNFDWLNCHFYSKMYAQLCVIYPFNFFFFITCLFLSTAFLMFFMFHFCLPIHFFPLAFYQLIRCNCFWESSLLFVVQCTIQFHNQYEYTSSVL